MDDHVLGADEREVELMKKKKTFVVYEVWTRSRIIKAKDYSDALRKSAPKPIPGLNLSNWHGKEVKAAR